jgi:hypothetical protein
MASFRALRGRRCRDRRSPIAGAQEARPRASFRLWFGPRLPRRRQPAGSPADRPPCIRPPASTILHSR